MTGPSVPSDEGREPPTSAAGADDSEVRDVGTDASGDASALDAFLASLREAEPETVDHLLAAAHALLAAIRTAVDAADAAVERQRRAVPREPRVRRIDVE